MNLKKVSLMLILTLVLAIPAFAGGMECPITSPTPDPTATMQESDTTTTSTSSATTGDAVSAADVSVTEGALGLVGAALALF